MIRILPLLTLPLLLGATAALTKPAAPDAGMLITPEIRKDISKWLNQEIVRLSIRTQNERYGNLSQDNIIKLDKQWRAERKTDDQPLIAATLSNPLSVYLSRMQGRSLGLYSEIFVMDNKGLNVGQSSITSDFWQGDEAKFQKTFPKGANTSFIDEAEWDGKYRIWKTQLNITISEGQGKAPIGVATIEVNLTELARRHTAAN